VLGRGLGELLRRLGDVSSFADRARVADTYLCAKRPALGSISGIANAATRVLTSSGCVRVSDLAHIRVGDPSVRAALSLRDRNATQAVRPNRPVRGGLRRKAAAPETRWTQVAHALGYHDQMHMVHDFNRLSGDSPTAIGSQLDMFVQPEVVSATWP